MIEFSSSLNGIIFEVKVQPRSARNDIIGVQAGALKIKLQAPPVEGEANKALIALLAAKLNIPKNDLKIIKGQHHPRKTVEVHGLNKNELLSRLAVYLETEAACVASHNRSRKT